MKNRSDIIELKNGIRIPIIGLGTSDPMHDIDLPKICTTKQFKIQRIINKVIKRMYSYHMNRKFLKSTTFALNNGYKLIDTSSAYNNEVLIRKSIEKSSIKREDLFIITRVNNSQQWKGNIEESLHKSLNNLGVDYVDLYMFHWPMPGVFTETWMKMEKLYEKGLVKSIGVANCHQEHLEKIFSMCKIKPMVNEFEIHPLLNQKELINFCKKNDIEVIGYTPIGRFHTKLRNNAILLELSKRYGKSIPQIILRWHFQNGIITIPRSMNFVNIKSNIDIFNFELSGKEMKEVDSINENLRLRFHPDTYDYERSK